MKFVVNAMPSEPSDCPWAEWSATYEITPRNSGRYICKVDNRNCDFDKNKHRCRWLITEDKD